MPELPEVETVRRGLQPLVGARLQGVAVRETRLRRRVRPAALRRLVGRAVAPLGRRAKYLLLPLVGGGGMIIHLGMSGRLFMAGREDPLHPHDHLSWWFAAPSGKIELRFRDPRRFATTSLIR